MREIDSLRKSVVDALDHREFESAVASATEMIERGDPWVLDGLVFRARALEYWIGGPPERLAQAARDWQRLVDATPVSICYRGLARVLLKMGDRESAFVNLLKAEEAGRTPEVLLGFARYYRTASPPDLERAKSFYLRAAFRGRTQGMRGYGEVAFDMGQPLRAWAMALAGLIATPMLFLPMGDRVHDGF